MSARRITLTAGKPATDRVRLTAREAESSSSSSSDEDAPPVAARTESAKPSQKQARRMARNAAELERAKALAAMESRISELGSSVLRQGEALAEFARVVVKRTGKKHRGGDDDGSGAEPDATSAAKVPEKKTRTPAAEAKPEAKAAGSAPRSAARPVYRNPYADY